MPTGPRHCTNAHEATAPLVAAYAKVDASAGDAKVRQVYEAWGYEAIGTSRPSPESPVLTAMIRPVRTVT
ncbi:hypothetical protein ACIGW0_32405 [Streptomyces bikiniensis]|uniref:Acetyltransferase n=1 Tax=Streptomyces bikiniensis TaxID=1896 RepID=A0ABW8D2G7_STRBI